MSVRFSRSVAIARSRAAAKRLQRHMQRLRGDERGSVFVLAALAMIALLGVAGIALDMGRIYIQRARLSEVADAGALAAAHSLRQGQTVARQQALGVAAANGFVDGVAGVKITVTFGTGTTGEQIVTVAITSSSVQLILLKPLINQTVLGIGSSAVAGVAPIDLALVLDQSSSMEMANAWPALKTAATGFIALLDDKSDQVGLVSFHLRAVERRKLLKPFVSSLTTTINNLVTVDGTNLEEGLAFGLALLQPPNARSSAVKVMVVFTDGQPNSFRGTIGGADRIMAADFGYLAGYWNSPNSLPTESVRNPDGCMGASTCFGYNGTSANTMATTSALAEANVIRSAGVFIYTIGLGNQNGDPWTAPDLNLLRQLANENGMTNASQPQGKMYFAPTKSDLQAAFQSVANDLLTRLVQ